MAEKSQHNQADDFEARVAEAVESRVAEAVEKHIQATRAKTKELKALKNRKASGMEGMDYVDRGDHYEVVMKGPFINTKGRVSAVFKESQLKQDFILFEGVPPITVKYPKIPINFCVWNYESLKDFRSNLFTQIAQKIREAPKEIHAAYKQAYYKAIEEYDERLKNKPPSDRDEDLEKLRDLEEEIEKIRDEQLRLARIKADKIIRDGQIRADQIRASYRKANTKNVGNQSGEVDPETVNVDLAAMLSAKGTFKESDIEKLISKRQAVLQVMAEAIIASARISADRIIELKKALLALLREKYEKTRRMVPGEDRMFDQAKLGFKVSDETQQLFTSRI